MIWGMTTEVYILCKFLRLKPHVEPAMAASPSRLIIAFISMCQIWASKSSYKFRMTLRNQQVLDEEMLLVLKVSSAEVSCSLSLFVKWMSLSGSCRASHADMVTKGH